MPQSATQTVATREDESLKKRYLTHLRQRFKNEVNRMTRGGMAELLQGNPLSTDASFLLSYVYALNWLEKNTPKIYWPDLLAPLGGQSRRFLMDLLLQAETSESFIRGYIQYWQRAPAENAPVQRGQIERLLQAFDGDTKACVSALNRLWSEINPLKITHAVAYRDLARHERERYNDMLSDADQQRLALIDEIADETKTEHFDKMGIIPAMGCPQTCRHCMFIWRPPVKAGLEPAAIYRELDDLSDNVLFTGGDLGKKLDHFYQAIRSMKNGKIFAILLNGDFADSVDIVQQVFQNMRRALLQRPAHWKKARVILQISFDEFHQEVIVDKKGRLKERIPVEKIANIVETAPKFSDFLQLVLVHKQHALNFSMDLFQKGVFGRLAEALGRRGHQIQLLSTTPSKRLKHNPVMPHSPPAALIKDASFVLTRFPESPILLTSSTIDAYGRAETIDPGEAVNEKDFLKQFLSTGDTDNETFDTDLMFWFNGWVTLFSAVHICLGNFQGEGLECILKRHHHDPLTRSLFRFDRRLLDYYAEVLPDLEQKIDQATGPHHLFHMLTEKADVRLHMTRRLLAK